MQDELGKKKADFKFPTEWCRFQHKELATRYNIIPKQVKEANFSTSQRISLLFTHFSIRFTRKIIVVFSIILVINIVWKQIISRFKIITNYVLNELEFVLWSAVFIALLLNLISKFIVNRIENGDYLFNENPVLLIGCDFCNMSGIVEENKICMECNSLGVKIGTWQRDSIVQMLKENPRWGMDSTLQTTSEV